MSNVTNINTKQTGYNFNIYPKAVALDSTGNQLVVGEKYEIYSPIAKDAGEHLGLRFNDEEDHSFTYAGCVQMGYTWYITSPDVYYLDKSLPKGVTPELTALLAGEGQPHPVCPVFVANKYVRPATDE